MTTHARHEDPHEDPREELRRLVARFRTALGSRALSGLTGVSRAPSPRRGEVPAFETGGEAFEEAFVDVGGEGACVGGPAGSTEVARAAVTGARGLAIVREELGDCQRCRLSEKRHNLVFGVGNPNAALVFVGEAPGFDEDRQGEPFVGKAGQLLTRMIEAMGFAREDVYICNVIKCRPPENRNPEPDEVASCEPFLLKQLGALQPRMIVALGKFAAQSICKETTPITRLRGNFRTYAGVQVMPTYHPAYLLRNPPAKKDAWRDLREVLAALARMGITPPHPPGGV